MAGLSPDRAVVTGYWQIQTDPAWVPPDGLEAFLAAGSPVVSIGFGSMGSRDATKLLGVVTNALAQIGARAVLLGGAIGLGQSAQGSTVFACPDVPHDWLFSRVDAVVHHGGAGTTGAALTAGVPAVIVPFAVDQPFWAHRAAQLGVSPAAIPRRQLTADRLARALRTCLTDRPMRDRARALGQRLRAEDGVGMAVARISNQLAS